MKQNIATLKGLKAGDELNVTIDLHDEQKTIPLTVASVDWSEYGPKARLNYEGQSYATLWGATPTDDNVTCQTLYSGDNETVDVTDIEVTNRDVSSEPRDVDFDDLESCVETATEDEKLRTDGGETYEVDDSRHAELNIEGLTAGMYMNTMEEMFDGMERTDAPESVWMCDHCEHENSTAEDMRMHLINDHDADDSRNQPRLDQLAELIKNTSAARGVDVYAVEVCGMTATDWGLMTERSQSTVSRNVRRGLGQE